jgi:uncharacterized protein (DUF1501 family)
MLPAEFQPTRHALSRRTLLQASAVLGGASWLNQVATQLARGEEAGQRPKSLIVLWMQGGPSQLETFDPHFNERHQEDKLGGQMPAIKTSSPNIEIAAGLPKLAEHMHHFALVRSIMSKEGDHERGTYHIKSGHRMIPNLTHPSLGAILCHEVQDKLDIPRHISIIPSQWPARGGYLGSEYNAFQTYDPLRPIPDVTARVSAQRNAQRITDLDQLDVAFMQRRRKPNEVSHSLQQSSNEAARKMMDSKHLAAFDVKNAPQTLREEFGDSPFGRSCLAALQLIEVGVRCVEVTLDGWDSHANNLSVQQARLDTLDAAFAALMKHLADRKLLQDTLVVWAGEFGRTPRINGLGGRDHWPHGFTVALAGSAIRGGTVLGETAPKPVLDEKDRLKDVANPQTVENVHATILKALGLDPFKEVQAFDGRPIPLSPGKTILRELLNSA